MKICIRCDQDPGRSVAQSDGGFLLCIGCRIAGYVIVGLRRKWFLDNPVLRTRKFLGDNDARS